MITAVHHVGIVVRRLPDAYAFWRDALGLPLTREADVPDQGVRAALLGCGAAEIELLEPTAAAGGVARFLERRGEGLHHLCVQAEDLASELGRLGAVGIELIDRHPRRGLAGMIAFVHPRAAAGTLVELATPLGPPAAHRHPSPVSLVAVEVAVADAPAAATRFRDLLGVPASADILDSLSSQSRCKMSQVWTEPDRPGANRTDAPRPPRCSTPGAGWPAPPVPGGRSGRGAEPPSRLVLGGVAIELAPAGGAARPGLAALRLIAANLVGVEARLRAAGIATRFGARQLIVGPGGASGVRLRIETGPPRPEGGHPSAVPRA